MALLFAALTLAARSFVRKPVPNVNASVTISVDAALNRHAIDPRIYGASFVNAATMADLGITLNRWGGNRTTRYNWQTIDGNTASDYFFENLDETGAGGLGTADAFVTTAHANGAEPVITIPMIGWTAKDATSYSFSVAKYGPQQYTDPNNADIGNGIKPDGVTKIVNDPTDASMTVTSAFEAAWVQHLVNTFGLSTAGGVRYYSLDNEPELWSSSQRDIHPTDVTYDEAWSRMSDYGAAIRAVDANAAITGPEEWEWTALFDSAADWNSNGATDRTAHGGVDYVDWLLQQAQAYETANGKRILSALTVHYYPQGYAADPSVTEYDPATPSNETLTSMKQLRNQSTRSLWDPNYTDQSWMGTTTYPGTGTLLNGGKPELIRYLKQRVAADYPGTLVGITEYNWGADNDISGGTAQADILGILGREGADLGIRWDAPPSGSFTYNAFKIYRNYDGAHSQFGDLSISAAQTDADIDNVSAFAALRSSDGALAIIVDAKTLSGDTPVTVNIANYLPSGAAQWWQLGSGNVIQPQAPVALVGSALSFTAPAQTINLFVIPGSYLTPPATVDATASSSSAVTVNWSAVAGAASYTVYRSTSVNGPFNPIGTTASTSFPDSGLAADTTYLYKVASVSGSAVSPLSVLDPATTTIFTTAATAGTVAQAVDITQLRTAVNAMRAAANVGTQTFTDPALNAGTAIKAVHVTELRTALDQARAALGISSLVYTDPTITPGVTTLKAAHITELRNGVK